MGPDRGNARAWAVAAVSGAVLAISIVVAVIAGEVSSAMWVVLVPFGMFGAGAVCITAMLVGLAGVVRSREGPLSPRS